MNEKTDSSKNIIKVVKITGKVLLCVIVLFLFLCPFLKIHIFTFTIQGDYADCIEDYYVAVYTENVCGFYDENGDQTIAFGNIDEYEEYIWKHTEVLDIVPYRRVLCFSKEADPEIYLLTNEDGTVAYGYFFVLRTSGENIHYYYRRVLFDARLQYSPLLYNNEKITFSYNGTTYELEDFAHFTSNIDFTKNEQILQIEGEPCYFK